MRETRRVRSLVALTAMVAATVALTAVAVRPASAEVVPVSNTGTLVAGVPAAHTPNARDGEARAFAEIGNQVFVGGTFTQVREANATAWTPRGFLFAYDRTTGALSTTFAPTLDRAVNALAVTPDGKLIVGGVFRQVNGVSRNNLVALDPVSGAIVAGWTGRTDGGTVRTMKVSGNHLYVGGGFGRVSGAARISAARIDVRTGAIDPEFVVDATVGRHGRPPYVWTLDVSPDGGTLLIGGNFTLVNGAARNQLAMIDLTGTPTVANWSTHRYVSPCAFPHTYVNYVQDVDFSDDGSYFIVGSNGANGWPEAYCDVLARFETAQRGSNLDATWLDITGNDSITSVEATDGVIYLGGHFRWLNNPHASDGAGRGAVDRLGIAAVDPANGMPLAWNPRRNGAPAGTTAWGSTIPVLWRGSDGLYFGHNSDGMGGQYHGRLGMFPLAGGRTVPVVNPPRTTPGYLYLGTASGALTKVAFTGTALGTRTVQRQPNLTGTRAAMRAGNKLYWVNGSRLAISTFDGTTVGASWNVNYNNWFNASVMSGAFVLDSRIYYTVAGRNTLYYRYFEPDGHVVGASEFTLPTRNLGWGTVRGMAVVGDRIVYGATDGTLRSVPFDPTAPGGVAVDGARATVLATPVNGLTWSSSMLFYASE